MLKDDAVPEEVHPSIVDLLYHIFTHKTSEEDVKVSFILCTYYIYIIFISTFTPSRPLPIS